VPFTTPTRSVFRATVLRALRDPNGTVFTAATVNDFINEAIMDLSSYRPKETQRSQPWNPDTWSPDAALTVDISDVWQVVARAGDLDPRKRTLFIPHADYQTDRAGWDFILGTGLRISRFWVERLQAWADREDTLDLAIFAYAYRTLPASDSSGLDFQDLIDQFCALQHCKMLGFQMLNADRALYQQWLAATNNTDVSPTQLNGMLGTAEASYDRARRRNTLLMRRPTNNYPTAF
jgi:hypothetical protein